MMFSTMPIGKQVNRRRRVRPVALAFLAMGLLLAGCEKAPELDERTYLQLVQHRNLGLAYLEENRLSEAEQEFTALVKLAPDEPLGYANLGLVYLRMDRYPEAEKWLKKAARLAGDDPDIQLLLAELYELTGQPEKAQAQLEKLLEKHPRHIRLLWKLASLYLRQPDSAALKKAEELLFRLSEVLPANVKVRLLLLETQVKLGRGDQALQNLETLRQILPAFPEQVEQAFRRCTDLLMANQLKEAQPAVQILHNLMKSLPQYQAAQAELTGTRSTAVGTPLEHFRRVKFEPPQKQKEIPTQVRLVDVSQDLSLPVLATETSWQGLDCADFDGDGDEDICYPVPHEPVWLWRNEDSLYRPLPGAVSGATLPGPATVARFADYDNDGHLDLLVGGLGWLRLLRNTGQGTFQDVTGHSGLSIAPEERVQQALFVDLDHEGDLDLLLLSSSNAYYFRNQGNGQFLDLSQEAGLEEEGNDCRDAVFGDFDDDGDTDFLILRRHKPLAHYDNLRQGYFRQIGHMTGLEATGGGLALAAADYNNDGLLDLFVGGDSTARARFLRNRGDGTFEEDQQASAALATRTSFIIYDAAFFDVDNDGWLDLLLAGKSNDAERGKDTLNLFLLYNLTEGRFVPATQLMPRLAAPVFKLCPMDYDQDGDLDVAMATRKGLRLLRNEGGNLNNYLKIRLTGLRSGSGKNNYFGIGARVEVKAGPLYQTRVMTRPVAHFGLGRLPKADVVRVVWTNGVAQNRFQPEKNQTIVETQILKGSCPWLFAWDGEKFTFVTDVLWASAIGMPLGILGTEMHYAFHQAAVEYMKIPGHKLRPRDGQLQLRFCTELWETPYLDEVKLVALDHPDSVQVFVDEKFTLPPFPPLRIYSVAQPHRPVGAWDDQGRDLLSRLAAPDGRVVDQFQPGPFQGITEKHDLYLDLGDLSGADSVFLFLYGWLFPTDASINVHIAQGGAVQLIHPHLQVLDEEGNWQTVVPSVSFPKGKNKMVVVDLTNKFLTDRYLVRIRTNMQIYWDWVFYATRVSGFPLRIQWLTPQEATLRYRGFSRIIEKKWHGPDIPRYQPVEKGPRWRDLIGYYTRYGDVRELLLQPDDRYVIMNAGDEIQLTFSAEELPDLPAGWQRDFLFYNVGWLKDGDLNTAHGQTVAPLPFHGMSRYPYGPEESYPDDEMHRQYLETYNLRFVAPEAFRKAVFSLQRDR